MYFSLISKRCDFYVLLRSYIPDIYRQKCSLPVSSYFIMLLQYFEEVLVVTFVDIFNYKVVNDKDKLDWSPLVSPKYWGCRFFLLIALVETFV